jgi:phosphatidylserine decarboxylase
LKIVPDGIYYACACLLAGITGSYLLNYWAGIPFYILAAFCLYFFRDPERITPEGDLIVSPADGKVVAIRALSETETRISIFLNVFNVHVNRTPVPGQITDIAYQAGKFLVASHEAASADNEQNTLTVEGPGGRVVCKQIAGLIARRIICYKKTGDRVLPGERIGYIKFGSRMDVIFGPEYKPKVKVGDKVAAGTSVLAVPVGVMQGALPDNSR